MKAILQSNNYNAYKVKIERYVDVPYSEEEKKHFEELEKQIKKDRELSMALDKVYKRYNILQITVEPLKNSVEIDIAETETRLDEMKKEVNNILQKTKKEKYIVKINNIDMEKRSRQEMEYDSRFHY